jgi:hypothetical protein
MTRVHTIRLAVVAALLVLVAGVTATVAHALAFDDGHPCPVTIDNSQPLFVCPSGSIGNPYSVQVVARGGCEPEFVFRVLNGAVPPGLSVSSSGLISGTPSQAGKYRFWLQVHDLPPSEGGPVWCTFPKEAEREFTITIDSALLITTNAIPQTASVGVPYSATLTAALVTGPSSQQPIAPSSLTWSAVGGTLPPGLTVANGAISGTPTTEGSYQFQVQAAIDASRKNTQSYSLTVRQPLVAAASKPLATTPAATVWETGLPFAAKITPSGGTGTYTITLASGTLPTGLVLGPDGTLSGTPSQAGVFQAVVGLADSEGRTAQYAANFAVAERLAVKTTALKPGRVGKLYRAKLASSGGVNPRVWKLAGGKLPKGLKLDRRLGIVSGIPKKPGSPRVTFQVTDGLEVVAKKTLRIVVIRPRTR